MRMPWTSQVAATNQQPQQTGENKRNLKKDGVHAHMNIQLLLHTQTQTFTGCRLGNMFKNQKTAQLFVNQC